jgi:putative MFS transporter
MGIGVELVTIDTYVSELIPKHLRGRAFAFNQFISFLVVPVVVSYPPGWCRQRRWG